MPTQEQIQQVIDAWKQADTAAAAAERAVTEASFRYAQGAGPRPPDDVVGDARMLRSLANERLEKALKMMNVAVKAGKGGPTS